MILYNNLIQLNITPKAINYDNLADSFFTKLKPCLETDDMRIRKNVALEF